MKHKIDSTVGRAIYAMRNEYRGIIPNLKQNQNAPQTGNFVVPFTLLEKNENC